MYIHRFQKALLLVGLIGLLCGCASVPFDAPKSVDYAFNDTADTNLGRIVMRQATAQPGQSGFYLLSDGIEALAARLLLSERAERSIDAQYYLLLDDITGQLFVAQLLRAADRGVRVRLLLDDITIKGYDDVVATIDAHPNVEIRLFNPFSRRGKFINAMGEFSRINRRMHNKSMTFDNQATIVGGRNIGAEYFSAREDSNYNDLDVLGFGPVAQDVSDAFDSYWNNPVAVPVSAFLKRSGAGDALIEYRSRIPEIFEHAKRSPYGGALQRTIIDAIDRRELELTWSAATVVADPPDKSKADFDNIDEQLSSILGPAVIAAKTELVVVSPYFVPRDSGVAIFRDLTARGVRVIIVTNSLAATDVTAVHSGYADYRKSLLEVGVELWEVRADSAREDRQRRGLGYSLSSLHTKAFAIDRRNLFIGSFNWDPRSVNINTEMGVYLDAPDLTAAVLEQLERQLPALAYRLRLDKHGDLEWLSQEDGDEVVHQREPKASFWKRFKARVYALLPIEAQL